MSNMTADELVVLLHDAMQIAKETKKAPTAVYQFLLTEHGVIVRGQVYRSPLSFAHDSQPAVSNRVVSWHEITLLRNVNAVGEAVLKLDDELAGILQRDKS